MTGCHIAFTLRLVNINVRLCGVFYLISFAASIPALLLLGPALDDPDFILGVGSDTGVLWGGLLDFVTALACAATAVVVFPVVRRHNESLALGFVTTRLIEASIIIIGVVSVLAVVTLRRDLAGDTAALTGDAGTLAGDAGALAGDAGALAGDAGMLAGDAGTLAGDAGTLTVVGRALVAVKDWTFLFGPGLMPAFNAAMFATLLLRARLVPRVIPVVGLVGAPLLVAAGLATLFGGNEQTSGLSLLATLPIAAWELAIGVWMITKGFRGAGVEAYGQAGVDLNAG
jgi:hypothetical protein